MLIGGSKEELARGLCGINQKSSAKEVRTDNARAVSQFLFGATNVFPTNSVAKVPVDFFSGIILCRLTAPWTIQIFIFPPKLWTVRYRR